MYLCQCKNLHSNVFYTQSEIKPALSELTERGAPYSHTDCNSITNNCIFIYRFCHIIPLLDYIQHSNNDKINQISSSRCVNKMQTLSLPPAEWRQCQPGLKSVQPSWHATYCTTGITTIESIQPEILYKLDGTPLLKQQVMQILHWHICHSGHFSLTVPYFVLAGHKFCCCEQK